MVTQKQFIDHYNNLYNNKAVYVWGANGEIITKSLTDRLYKTYGSSTYNKAYYDNKYKEGNGRIGADCSGSIYPLSKKDNTAKGYYNECLIKGSINNIPKDKPCLIFNAKFTHVGAYLGNGITIEMASSLKNCVKESFNKTRWAYYGIPNWLESNNTVPVQPSKPVINNDNKIIISNVQKWLNSYCNLSLSITGVFDAGTKKALCRALQICLNTEFNANLKIDGVFGNDTKSKCKTADKSKTLTYICQIMLLVKGYDMSHSIKNNDLDKTYGTKTKNTVTMYQQNTHGLRHDGECGPATFYMMFNS